MEESRQIGAEKFQIIYVVSLPSLKRSITPHCLSMAVHTPLESEAWEGQ